MQRERETGREAGREAESPSASCGSHMLLIIYRPSMPLLIRGALTG